MGINIIKVNNKRIISYKLPSQYKNDERNIGNKLEDFEILQIMGEGTFGFVAKVKSKLNLEIYALKKNIINAMDDEKEKKKLKNEFILLKYFDHPNVCKCLTSFEQDNNNYIVMQLFKNKDLFQYLNANRIINKRIEEEILWDIFLQCLEGLLYLHNKGIIHRDIKPGNILMDDKGILQIGDFGVSVVMNINEAAKFTNDPEEQQALVIENPPEKIGTPNFLAPEIEYLFPPIYDQRADVYSMGICFYALCYYELPYMDGKNMNELINDEYYSYELRDVIFQMIQINQSQRGSSSEIYSLFKKYYIIKYVKNSGIYSVVQCLFSFQNFKNYFTDEHKIATIIETKYTKKVSLILISVIQALKDKKSVGENTKANIM